MSTFMLNFLFPSIGDRTTYDRPTLLSLANSPFSKAQPGKMAYVPGITKSASVPSGVSFGKKSVEQKKEAEHKKKSTCKSCPSIFASGTSSSRTNMYHVS
jgi:hypothetical protein